MADTLIETLCNHIDQADDINALARMMPHIGIEIHEVQELMKRKIQTLKEHEARKALFQVMPLESLLPMDGLQHILSFNHFTIMKNVSKSFKRCFDQNQEIIKRSRQSIIDEHAHHFSPNLSFDKSSNKTFVVCPPGESLMESVQAIGDDVIVHHDFKDCFFDPSVSSGDRIFVQDGCYEVDLQLWIEDECRQIIGIGSNITLKLVDDNNAIVHDCAVMVRGESKVFFKNISFEFSNGDCLGVGFIGVEGQSEMWMEDCIIGKCEIGVSVEEEARAHFKSCTFKAEENAIWIDTQKEFIANIIGCTFGECQHSVETKVPVRCIGNVFVENLGAVICTKEMGRKAFMDGSTFKGNVFEKFILDLYD